jgi:hypothetical protein
MIACALRMPGYASAERLQFGRCAQQLGRHDNKKKEVVVT